MRNGKRVDLDDYVIRMKANHPNVEVYVGCDSQNYTEHTVYVSTVVFRFPKQGAQVIYLKEKVGRITDMWTRLWAETERSISLALHLQRTCNVRVKQIDMDYNADPAFPSNKLISPAMGYAESYGFTAKTKPDLLMATWAANVLCH